jgi:hypothetical protein
MLFITGIGHGLAHEHLYPNKDRSIAMLTSSIRLCYFLHVKSSRMVSSLLADSSLLLYVISLGFLAVNMELSGITRQVPSFGI